MKQIKMENKRRTVLNAKYWTTTSWNVTYEIIVIQCHWMCTKQVNGFDANYDEQTPMKIVKNSSSNACNASTFDLQLAPTYVYSTRAIQLHCIRVEPLDEQLENSELKNACYKKNSIRNGERDTQRIDRLISHLDWKPAIKLWLENIHFVYMKLSNHNKACQSVIMIISIWVCRSTFVVFPWKISIWRLRIFYSQNFDKTKP